MLYQWPWSDGGSLTIFIICLSICPKMLCSNEEKTLNNLRCKLSPGIWFLKCVEMKVQLKRNSSIVSKIHKRKRVSQLYWKGRKILITTLARLALESGYFKMEIVYLNNAHWCLARRKRNQLTYLLIFRRELRIFWICISVSMLLQIPVTFWKFDVLK